MALTLEKLMKYDLVEDIESGMRRNEKKMNLFFEFFNIYQQIQNTDQFIRDFPAFPGSTDKIRRSELVLSVGFRFSP